MRILLVPFYSQQDKRTGEFLVDSDGSAKQARFLARKMAGHECDVACPSGPSGNLDRKFSWDQGWCRAAAGEYDLVVSWHPTLAVPLSAYGARVVTECGTLPPPGSVHSVALPLVRLAWQVSSAVFCELEPVREEVRKRTDCPVHLWPFGFDGPVSDGGGVRDVDALFPARASATEYSGHTAWQAAADYMPDLRLSTPDPTSYLRRALPEDQLAALGVPEGPLTQEEYARLLSRSKVVVGLSTDMASACVAFTEAAAAGAVPVALRNRCYEYLLGRDWPHYAESSSPSEVARAVRRALHPDAAALAELRARLPSLSWEATWSHVKEDLGL